MFDTPFKIAQFIIGLLGAITTVTCFVPQGIKTLITRDTSGLSKWFFISAIISSFFWLSIGSLAIAHPFVEGHGVDGLANGLSSGLPSIITNVITLVINITILTIKLTNIYNAKKLNMDEALYCNQIRKNKLKNL